MTDRPMTRGAVAVRGALVLGGLLLGLALTEGALRIVSFAIAAWPAAHAPTDDRHFTILCLGDSSTRGLGATDRSRYSYPGRLQELLEAAAPHRFAVVNRGVSGINSSQVLNRLDGMLSQLQPDLLIVMIGMNDPWNLRESRIIDFYTAGRVQRLLLRIELAVSRLRSAQLLRLAWLSLEFGHGRESDRKYAEIPKPEIPQWGPDARRAGLDASSGDSKKRHALAQVLEANITAILLRAGALKVPVLFMSYQAVGWGRPNEIIDDIYRRLEVPVVDNFALFRDAARRGLSVKAADNFHPNDLGYLLMARTIFNSLISLGVVEATPVPVFDE